MFDVEEVYVFVCKGIAGAPPDQYGLHITAAKDDSPKPLPDRTMGGLAAAGYTYWALSFGKMHLLVHIYYEGGLPEEPERNGINANVVQGVLRALDHWDSQEGEGTPPEGRG